MSSATNQTETTYLSDETRPLAKMSTSLVLWIVYQRHYVTLLSVAHTVEETLALHCAGSSESQA